MDENAARSAFDGAIADYKQEFGKFFLARLYGLDISYADDACIIRFPVHDFMFNPQGTLHGGVIGFVMDVSMGHLLHHSFGVGGATLEMKMQFLSPVRPPKARCEGRFLRKGRSICFLESRLFDSGDVLAAIATSTWRMPTTK